MDMHTLLYSKRITSKDHCIVHETLLNVMWQPGWEEIWERMDACICMAEFLHCSSETIATFLIGLYPTTKLKVFKNK